MEGDRDGGPRSDGVAVAWHARPRAQTSSLESARKVPLVKWPLSCCRLRCTPSCLHQQTCPSTLLRAGAPWPRLVGTERCAGGGPITTGLTTHPTGGVVTTGLTTWCTGWGPITTGLTAWCAGGGLNTTGLTTHPTGGVVMTGLTTRCTGGGPITTGLTTWCAGGSPITTGLTLRKCPSPCSTSSLRSATSRLHRAACAAASPDPCPPALPSHHEPPRACLPVPLPCIP